MKTNFPDVKSYVSSNRKILALLGGFFLFTFILSLFYPRFSDSIIHMVRSDYIFSNLAFPFAEFGFNSAKAYVYPPLFHILLGVSKTLTGFYGLVPSFMGGLSVFLTYKLVNLWYDSRTAFLSALALSLFPFFIIWSAIIYIGTTVTAGFLLVFYFYFRYLEYGVRRDIFLSFVFGGLLASLKTYGPLASILVGVHLLLENRESLEEILQTVSEVFVPGLLGVALALPWPLRNFLMTGSPLPKVTGVPYSYAPSAKLSVVWVFVPTLSELVVFVTQFTGVIWTSVLAGLKNIHPMLYFLWFALPILLFSLLTYGALDERDNSFVWMWIFSLIVFYEVQRFMSRGVTSMKFRHFITLSPILALFMARSYQKLPVSENLKKLFYIGLASGLIIQMLGAAFIFTDSINTSYQPMGEWLDGNVPEDDVIYSPDYRQVVQFTDTDFKVITTSYKPGYVFPNRSFADEVGRKADWVVVPDHPAFADELERIEAARDDGVLKLEHVLNSTSRRIYGEVGKVWRIYSVR
jgi:4-amino-4-deoxy-L-arabinose transferase-like glycosyltransferase